MSIQQVLILTISLSSPNWSLFTTSRSYCECIFPTFSKISGHTLLACVLAQPPISFHTLCSRLLASIRSFSILHGASGLHHELQYSSWLLASLLSFRIVQGFQPPSWASVFLTVSGLHHELQYCSRFPASIMSFSIVQGFSLHHELQYCS